MQQIWIIGCGDIGRRVAKRIKALYQNPTYTASALVRSEKSARACNELGLNTMIHNLDETSAIDPNALKDAMVYYFAPPPKHGDTDTRLAHFLDQVGHVVKRIVLISTTGVYGNSAGEWIDETTPVNPGTDRAKRRLSAEMQLSNWSGKFKGEYIILRVPGIYSEDRLPLERLQKQLPVVRAEEAGFTNRIHADDLAEICIKAMRSDLSGEIFNVTDGQPSTMVDYFNQVADYSGLPRPEQITMAQAEQVLSAGMLSYAKESRRIRNDKLISLLGVTLRYPSLESALGINEKQ